MLQVRFDIVLEGHQISHASSKIIIKPNFLEFGIDHRNNIKIVKELSIIYSRIMNQYMLKYQTVFFNNIW